MSQELPQKRGGAAAAAGEGGQERHAFYVYGIGARADLEPLFAETLPEGIEGSVPLEIVVEGELAAIASTVPLKDYDEEALEAHLADPEWTAARAARHQKVVAHFAERAGIVPLRFGTIYRERSRIAQMLSEKREELSALTARVQGREEWSLNLFCERAKLMKRLDSTNLRLREASERAASAPPGQAYLLRKKTEALRSAEARAEIQRVTAAVAEALAARSDGAKRLNLLRQETAEPGELAARLSFLVARDRLAEFRAVAEQLAREHTESGFTLELVGPWPAFNFTDAATAAASTDPIS